jgi:tRNA (guanine37-N1)-methyltransferase
MLEQARRKGIISVELKDLRHFTHDAHGTADDYQFGGGHGMVLKPEPVFEAVEDVLKEYTPDQRAVIPIVLLTPQGEVFNQRVAQELSNTAAMVLICGHYAGVDERVRLGVATREISIGDFVLTGGELAAMVVVDAVARLVPGVIGSVANVEGDSITSGLLQHPLYTRPAEFRGMEAPAILRSGNHGEIDRWRRRESLRRTLERRPHLLEEAELNAEDREFLRSLGYFGRNA